MKLTDKLKHYLCLVLAIVTCLMVALIAILSWGIVMFAIYDINTSHTFHSIEVYKISAAFWALLALPSHVFFLNFDKVREASWFALPKVMPVKPIFDMRAIVPVLIMFIVTAVETIGDISGVMEGGLGREATDKELSGGVVCDGLGSSLAALFGVLPNTSFSQNVGLVTMTKVVNRMALACGAGVLILCGLFPKLAALISIMPQSVLGGAAVMMFSSIVVSGIQLITKEKLTGRNITIVSVALGLGY